MPALRFASSAPMDALSEYCRPNFLVSPRAPLAPGAEFTLPADQAARIGLPGFRVRRDATEKVGGSDEAAAIWTAG